MSALSPSWLPLIMAAVLAAVAWWLNHLASRPLPVAGDDFAHRPDLIIDRFTATAFDAHGSPRYTLAAAQLRYYPDDDTTELSAPRFRMQAGPAPTVEAEAARGLISPKGEHVHLIERVHIRRAATPEVPALIISTHYLHIIPEAQILQTDQAVHVQQGASQLTAQRLYFDGRARRLELGGGVRGVYAPR